MTVFVQHPCFCADADQCADGIEHIDEQKCENNRYEAEYVDSGKPVCEALTESLSQIREIETDDGFREHAEIACFRIRYI